MVKKEELTQCKHMWFPKRFEERWMPDMSIYGYKCYRCGAHKWKRIVEKAKGEKK